MTETPNATALPAARLAGKHAVVTGGTTGLGFAAAERLTAEGARVIITGQNADRLNAAAARLGPAAIPVRADVRKLAELNGLADTAREVFGTVDVLFANAGVGAFATLDMVDEAFFDEQFDVNVKGLFFTVQALLPLLADRASIILNASSVNAKGLPGASVYSATKAAVRSFARSLASELGPRGIRVNAISPGMVPTEFQGKMGLPKEALDGFAAQITGTVPLRRVGRPEEIAAAVAFLASDDAAYVTGADLLADGGFMSV